MRDKLYFYSIHDIQVVDGDTIRCTIDLGLKCHMCNQTIRIVNMDCFETRRNSRAKKQAERTNLTLEEVVEKGKLAKGKLIEIVENAEHIYVNTIKRDAFGRWLGDVFFTMNNETNNLSEYFITENLALEYE